MECNPPPTPTALIIQYLVSCYLNKENVVEMTECDPKGKSENTLQLLSDSHGSLVLRDVYLLYYEDMQGTLCRCPCGEELKPSDNCHINHPPWKQVILLQTNPSDDCSRS